MYMCVCVFHIVNHRESSHHLIFFNAFMTLYPSIFWVIINRSAPYLFLIAFDYQRKPYSTMVNPH